MRALKILLLCYPLVLAGALPATAAPNTSSGGQKCDESDSNVKHNIGGKPYTCDKCVFTTCDSSGGAITNCKRTTEYTNCVAAAGSGGGGAGPARVNVDRVSVPISPPPKGPSQAAPPKKQQ